MGNCASCLGVAKNDDYDEDEAQGLLFEDAGGYGSFPEAALASQTDVAEAQRQMEALQQVVSKTSENMVDIFEIAPQTDAPRPMAAQLSYAGHEARIVRYQTLISKLNLASSGDELDVDGIQVEWLSTNDDEDAATPIKLTDDKPLVGTFADAAAAMG